MHISGSLAYAFLSYTLVFQGINHAGLLPSIPDFLHGEQRVPKVLKNVLKIPASSVLLLYPGGQFPRKDPASIYHIQQCLGEEEAGISPQRTKPGA